MALPLPVRVDDPIDVACPRCDGAARREADTLDTFVCSAWYALRFCDPHAAEAPFARAEVDRFLPIDVYVGGLEHAAQHMLYFRFVTRFLHDLGQVGVEEPVRGFTCNGMVLGADGRKMSKSAGNGRDPDALLDAFGADALRLAVLADTPVEGDVAWDDARAAGKARFLERFAARIDVDLDEQLAPAALADGVHALIGALDRDIAAMSMNVAVARVHELAAALRGVSSAPLVRDALTALWPLIPGWVEARWRPGWGPIGRWPQPRSAGTAPDRVVVQVDGRRVAVVEVPRGADPGAARAAAERAASNRLGGRAVARMIEVPGRLINFVTTFSE